MKPCRILSSRSTASGLARPRGSASSWPSTRRAASTGLGSPSRQAAPSPPRSARCRLVSARPTSRQPLSTWPIPDVLRSAVGTLDRIPLRGMPTMSLQLTGIIPPLVTPFIPGSEDLDERALRSELRYLLEAGVHGVTLCGSTGEGHTLSVEETVRCAEVAVEEVRGRVPVVIGIIRDSTREVIRYGLALKRVGGVDALQITPVHYLFNPGPEGTYAYYQEIGQAVGLPIVIYNVVPWST